MGKNQILAFFGIEIDKSFFGKKPAESESRSIVFSPAYRLGLTNHKKVNQYGAGVFKPYDVVPLDDYAGDFALSFGLSLL